MPPKVKSAYGPETVGRVFRFTNGTVQPEPRYYWHRPGQGQVGRIGRMIWHEEKDGNQTKMVPTHFIPIPQYKTTTVFDCGSSHPCVFTESDMTATDLQSGPWPEKKLWPLAFKKEGDGVSRVVRGGAKQAAGSDASWVGTLVPEIYKNQEEDAKPSQGLGGDLGPLLGLMALSEPAGRGDDAFKYHWQHCQWKGRRQASRESPHYQITPFPPLQLTLDLPVPSDKPIRGVVVHIALDRDEALSQNWDNLRDFEKNGIAVIG